jgi:large subunit ribosomal protein L7e
MPTLVPELLAKKRKRDDEAAAKRAADALASRKKARVARKDIFKRAEKYVAEYRQQVREQKDGELIASKARSRLRQHPQ